MKSKIIFYREILRKTTILCLDKISLKNYTKTLTTEVKLYLTTIIPQIVSMFTFLHNRIVITSKIAILKFPKNLFIFIPFIYWENYLLSLGLGHPRFPETDLNLLLQLITLVIIFVSLYYKKKQKLKIHGTIMGIAVITHLISFLLVMGSKFFTYFEFYSTQTSIFAVQTAWVHIFPGIIALVLGLFLVTLWAINTSNVKGCYSRKRIMDVTLVLWLFSLIFGIVTYALFYL